MSTVEEMMKNAKSKETAIQNGSSTYKYTYTRADGTKITSRRGTPAVPKKAPGPSSSSSSSNKGVFQNHLHILKPSVAEAAVVKTTAAVAVEEGTAQNHSNHYFIFSKNMI